MQAKTVFFCLCSILFLTSLASCPGGPSDPPRDPLNYYFDSVAGDDDNSGASETEALQSISFLNSITLVPGDTIYIKKGSSWASWIQIDDSGTATQPITITTYDTGNKPELKPTASKKPVITLNGSYIHVSGLYVNGVDATGPNESYGVQLGDKSSNNIIENCEITKTAAGIACQGTGHIMRSNYIHDLEMMVNTPIDENDNDDYGLSVSG